MRRLIATTISRIRVPSARFPNRACDVSYQAAVSLEDTQYTDERARLRFRSLRIHVIGKVVRDAAPDLNGAHVSESASSLFARLCLTAPRPLRRLVAPIPSRLPPFSTFPPPRFTLPHLALRRVASSPRCVITPRLVPLDDRFSRRRNVTLLTKENYDNLIKPRRTNISYICIAYTRYKSAIHDIIHMTYVYISDNRYQLHFDTKQANIFL